MNTENQTQSDDSLGTGLTILSFCIPIAGAAIYFSSKKTQPNKAKAACHAALWGFGVAIIIQIFATVAAG